MADSHKQNKPDIAKKSVRSLTYNEMARLVMLAGLVIFAILNVNTFLTILRTLMGVLSPVFIGIFIAFVLNIPLSWFEKSVWHGTSRLAEKTRRPMGILFALLILVALIALLVILVIPQSIMAISQITEQIPSIYKSLIQWVESLEIPALQELLKSFDFANLNLREIFTNTGLLAGGVFRGITDVLGVLMNVVLGLGFAIFMLAGKEKLLKQIEKLLQAYMAPQPRGRLKYFVSVVSDIFSKYIFGQVTEAIVIGILTTVAMLIFRFPYATIIGPLTGLSGLIPMVGAVIGGVVGFLLILTVNPLQAMFFVIFILVLQEVDGMLIYPKIVGDSVGLPQLWTFFAVVVGGALFGFIGIFLGVPTMAVAYRLLREDAQRRLAGKDTGGLAKYQILTIPKGTDPVRLK